MSCYFKIEEVTYHVLMEIMSATIDFNFFFFSDQSKWFLTDMAYKW